MAENIPEISRVQVKKGETFEKIDTPESIKIDQKLQQLELSLVKNQAKEKFIEKMKKTFLDKGAEIKVENNKILILIGENVDINQIYQIIEGVKIEGEKIGYDFNLDGKIGDDEFLSFEKSETVDQNGFIGEFGRFYMSGGLENWDLPNDINNINYSSYLLGDKTFTGKNLGITAKNLSKTSTSDDRVCFSDKKLITTQDGKKYLVVIGESDQNQKIHLDENYKDLNDLTAKIRAKTKTKEVEGKEILGIEAWVSELSGKEQKQMNIYEAGDPQVHQFVKVDVVDKGVDEENPIHLLKDLKGEYKYEFFDKNRKLSSLNFGQKEIEEFQKMYEVGADGKIKPKKDVALKIDLTNKGIDPKEIENTLGKDGLYFMFEKNTINGQEVDTTFKMVKEENSIKIVPTEKIVKREIVDLGFGVSFDKTNFLYNSPFIKELSKIEKQKQTLNLRGLYGWGDIDADIEFSPDLKSIKGIKLRTVGNEIQINDVNLNLDIKNEKDIHNLYTNIMRTISRSLNISYMSKTGILQAGDSFKYDPKTSNVSMSYANLKKIPQEKWNQYYEQTRKSHSDEYGDISFLISSKLINPVKFKYADVKSHRFQGVGGLSAKFESSSKGSEAIGYDKTGGASYGIYQIATKTGGMSDFLKFSQEKNPTIYSRLNPKKGDMWRVNGSFANEWIAIARDKTLSKEFGELQHNYVKATHYDLAMSKLNNPKLVNMINASQTLQEVMRSTATQHGGTGAANLFNGVYRESMSDKELINAVYSSRGTKFGSSTQQVRHAVQNRFVEEKSIALAMLDKEKKGGTTPQTTPQAPTRQTEVAQVENVPMDMVFSQLKDGTNIPLGKKIVVNYNGKNSTLCAKQFGDTVVVQFDDKEYKGKLPVSGVVIQNMVKKGNGLTLASNFGPINLDSQKFAQLLTQMADNQSQITIGEGLKTLTLTQTA